MIEGLASLIVVWRFTGSRTFSHAAETRAQKLVAIQFFILAPYVAIESTRALIGDAHGRDRSRDRLAHYHAAARDREAAPRRPARLSCDQGEGRQHILCAYLAAALLGNVLVGAW